MKCWNHRNAVPLDEEWLVKPGRALSAFENHQRRRERGRVELRKNVGGSRIDPSEIRGIPQGVQPKLALLLPANVKNGGKARLEEIIKEGCGKWDTGRKLGHRFELPENAHVYFHETWLKKVFHRVTMQRFERQGRRTLLIVSDPKQLERAIDLQCFKKHDGQIVRGPLRGHAYVIDPEA
jgi:hypothetical protein